MKYRSEINEAANKYGLQPALVEAQVLVESSGRSHAYRFEPDFWMRYLKGKPEWEKYAPHEASASYGLMQIMFPVAVELGFTGKPEDLFRPEVNLEFGCKKLARLMKWAKGNEMQALAAYNGGKGGNSKPPFRNQAYALKVLENRARLLAGLQPL